MTAQGRNSDARSQAMSEKAAPERADRFFLNSASGLTIDATAAVGGKSFKRRSEVPAGSRNLVAGAGADRVADIARSNPKIAIAAGAAVAAVAAAAVWPA